MRDKLGVMHLQLKVGAIGTKKGQNTHVGKGNVNSFHNITVKNVML